MVASSKLPRFLWTKAINTVKLFSECYSNPSEYRNDTISKNTPNENHVYTTYKYLVQRLPPYSEKDPVKT